MPSPLEPDKTYVCPKCGQNAQIGAHFCEPFVPPEKAPPLPKARSGSTPVKPRVLYLAAGLFVLVLVLWRWVGPASLVLLALGLLGWLLWGQPRTGKGNQAKHAAKSPGSGLENKDLSTDSKSDSKTPPPDPPAKSKR